MQNLKKRLNAFFMMLLILTGTLFFDTDTALSYQGSLSLVQTVQAAESTGTYVYNGAGAVAYADKYWSSYSPFYPDYNAIGGDCANFTSQCLAAGGLPMTSGWYHAKTGIARSSSWTYAQGLYDYLSANCGKVVELYPNSSKSSGFSNKNGSKELKPQSILHVGDAVFYYSTAKKRYGHAAICVGFSSNGTPLVSAHNSNRNHVTWNLGKGWGHWAVVQISKSQSISGKTKAPASATTYTGQLWKTSVSGLTIYSAMKTSSSKRGTIYKKAVIPVTQLKTIGNVIWGKTSYSGKSGYVILRKNKTSYNAKKISEGTGAEDLTSKTAASGENGTTSAASTDNTKQFYKVKVSGLKLRQGPSLASTYLHVSLVKNVVVKTECIKTVGSQKWAKITYLGKSGYICLENGHVNAVKVSSYSGIAVKKLTLNRSRITFTKLNTSRRLRVKAYLPKGAAIKSAYYLSTNTKVAKVTQKGLVTAQGKGSCQIKVYARDGRGAVAVCKVTVK